MTPSPFIPANAGIQRRAASENKQAWVPAYAGTNGGKVRRPFSVHPRERGDPAKRAASEIKQAWVPAYAGTNGDGYERDPSGVMPAHSRPKDGVLSHAYVAGHVFTTLHTPSRGWPGRARP